MNPVCWGLLRQGGRFVDVDEQLPEMLSHMTILPP